MEAAIKVKKGAFEKRIHEIDLIRGFLIILVVVDHVFWCLKYYGNIWYGPEHVLYRVCNFYWTCTARGIIQPIALGAFCFISGISTAFSKNNWKRSTIMVIFWAIIAIISNIIQLILDYNDIVTDIRVDFNIIGVLAFCNLIFCFIQKRSWKATLAAILIAWLMSSYFIPSLRNTLFNIIGGRMGTRAGGIYNIPNAYSVVFWEYPIQADYVPLFPYIVFFLFGALFSILYYRESKKSLFPNRKEWERPICFVGRHTLIIYLSHFIMIRGIFIIINIIMTGKFA